MLSNFLKRSPLECAQFELEEEVQLSVGKDTQKIIPLLQGGDGASVEKYSDNRYVRIDCLVG